MRIIHLSYANVPEYNDPQAWLKRISHSTGVLESMSKYAEVIGIYHINYRGILQKNGVTYHFPGFNRWQLLLPFQFNNYVKRLNPDAVIVHGLISPWQVVMLRWQVGSHLKIIVQHHAERPLKDIRQYFQRWADRYIGAYLFCSFDQGKLWMERHQIRDSRKIKEIIGTSSSFYPMDKNEARLTTKISDRRVYVWVGGLDANKDPLTVAKAFIRFLKFHQDAKLYMIYQTFQLERELKILVNKTPAASDFICLLGKIPHEDLHYWYNSSDFIISSSHYEGSGIAVCEAMSCGCIPVLTNIPSFRMMTDQGRIGLLYDAGNEEALFDVLQRSLGINLEDERKKVLEQFNRELSFDANARKIMQVIRDTQ